MNFIKAFLAALVGSVVINAVLLFVFRSLVINPDMPLHALSLPLVTVFTTIGAVGATIVYAIMRAFMSNLNKIFIWISAVVLVLSFIPDFLIIGQTTGPFAGGTVGTAILLMVMHVAAAAAIVYSLVKLWGAKIVTM